MVDQKTDEGLSRTYRLENQCLCYSPFGNYRPWTYRVIPFLVINIIDMTTLEIVLFIGLAVWIGTVVMKSDKLIRDIHRRLDEIEKHLEY